MKKILMIILDGFGMREDVYGNAVKNAGMNNFIDIWNNYPHCLLKANEQAVMLQKGQCSNSAHGHKTIGAGKKTVSDLTIVDEYFKTKKMKNNVNFQSMLKILKKNKTNLHIQICLSDGGVISHYNHLINIMNYINEFNIENEIYLHLVSDGRDSDKKSFMTYYEKIKHLIKDNVHLATLCGRYYALDNTKDYKRTKLYYNLLLDGEGIDMDDLEKMVNLCYTKKITDEYLPPFKTKDFVPLKDNDVFLFMNISKYHQRQFYESINGQKFNGFNAYDIKLNIFSLFDLNKKEDSNYFIEEPKLDFSLGEYLSKLGLTQARIMESIRSKEMTYYLDGCNNEKIENCDLYKVDSPKVDSFDMKPEMNSLTVAKTIISCMEKDYDFIIANFANPDEVGRTGNYQATINGMQAIDVCLGKIIETAEDNFYKIVIVGSHSKADTIIDRNNNIITKNTLSPVPFIIMDKKIKLKNGILSNFTPTLLKYMDISLPKEIKNEDILLEKKQSKK